MPRVLDISGQPQEVDDALYIDMFDECLVGTLGDPRYLTDYLQSVLPEDRHKLESYIISRLAEVDPGYVAPEVVGHPTKEEQLKHDYDQGMTPDE